MVKIFKKYPLTNSIGNFWEKSSKNLYLILTFSYDIDEKRSQMMRSK